MKYQGIIRITDVVGTVFERSLTPDEIIEALLPSKEESFVMTPESVESVLASTIEKAKKHGAYDGPDRLHVVPAKRKYTKRATNEESHFIKGKARPCCGSKGPRHMKTCPHFQEKATGRRALLVQGRHLFSESTYDLVKGMRETVGVDFIVREKGLDIDEVRRADLSDDYDDYLKIA